MTNEKKPKILYRGVKINYELLKKFELYGVDLKPPHPPMIDENGRKVVGDGNEYGVYMTDHDVVARNAYAAVKHNDGTPINKNIMFGYDRERTMIPSVGIVYKIDTDGIDVHIPWITSYLKGHYNNGMGGNEWIAESIPASNYSIDTIEIGPDTLHDSEMIKIGDITEAKEEIIEKIEARKKRLELFEAKIESLSDKERLSLSSNKIDVLREIYKIDGIMDVDIQSFRPTSADDYLKYLMAVSYSADKDNIDFTTLEYLQTMKSKIKDKTELEDLMNLIDNDIATNQEKKEKFVSKKQLQGEEYSTVSFDKKNAMYSKLKQQLEEKTHSKDTSEQTGYSIEEDGNIYTETQQQVLIDNSGKELGNRVITWKDNIATGTREVETIGILENEDGKYSMKEVSRGIGTELQYQRKEMNCLNKITGQKEQYVYQKDDKGNEMYYRIADGKLTFKITKSNKGTIIDQYDKGQLTDTFEYDENSIAIMGMEGIDSLDENYVENFFDSQVPYFETKNKEKNNQSHFEQTVDTQKLGKETIDIQKDPTKMDAVEQQINEQMREQTQQREGKRENMQGYTRTTDEYVDEVVKQFEQDLEKGVFEQEEQKKKDSHKVEKGDDDYVM